MPKKGGKPSKMFTGSDPSGPHMDLKNYALGSSTRMKQASSGDSGLRHQKPNGVKSK